MKSLKYRFLHTLVCVCVCVCVFIKKINISNFFLFFLHITYYKISATPERATNQKPLYF